MGLSFIEVPPYIDMCKEMDETFKCIHDTLHNNELIKAKVKNQFAIFANQFTRLQRTCDCKLTLYIFENVKIYH